MQRVLIAGVSTRAAAESAVRAGYDVVGVDAYADLDHPSECQAPPGGVAWRASTAVTLAAGLRVDAVVYLSNFENDPRAVASLAAGRALWGNPPDVLRRARDPQIVRDAFRSAGIPAPEVAVDAGLVPGTDWLLKPNRSGGGVRVRRWRRGRLPPGHYAQRRVEGRPGSVVFVAAAGRARVLGTTRQLVGDAAFGARGFRYCGSLLDGAGAGDASVRQAAAIADAAAAAFGLVGVGGVDFVDDGRMRHPIEVNPRWTASMELVERAGGVSVFAAHAAACTTGLLPELAAPAGAVHGKAIVFARHDVTLGDTRAWLDDPTLRDITRPGALVRAGRPVCTVLVCEADEDACYRALVGGAERIHAQLAQWARAVA